MSCGHSGKSDMCSVDGLPHDEVAPAQTLYRGPPPVIFEYADYEFRCKI
jgi:hypothetical protein